MPVWLGGRQVSNMVTFPNDSSRYIVNTMRRFFRLTLALFSAVFLVSSTLVTSGFACPRSGGGEAMTGMAMATTSARISSASNQLIAAAEVPASPSSSPCRSSSAPASCQTMVPCGSGAVAVQHVVGSGVPREILRVASAAVVTPASETKAPELPPPRA